MSDGQALLPLDTLQPKVGQLLYRETRDPQTKEPKEASLFYIDSSERLGTQYLHSELAHMEDFGQGIEVYTGFECGGLPASYLAAPASDEHIALFVQKKLEVEGENGILNLANWVNGIKTTEDCHDLLSTEKERLISIVEQVISEAKGDKGTQDYRSLLGLPYQPEN